MLVKFLLILTLLIGNIPVKGDLFGTASYYHNKFQGRKTASGEKYDVNKYTAACNKLPLGTIVEVTNVRNGKCVVVRINDKIGTKHRIIDLSRIAAEELGYINQGLTKVKIKIKDE